VQPAGEKSGRKRGAHESAQNRAAKAAFSVRNGYGADACQRRRLPRPHRLARPVLLAGRPLPRRLRSLVGL